MLDFNPFNKSDAETIVFSYKHMAESLRECIEFEQDDNISEEDTLLGDLMMDMTRHLYGTSQTESFFSYGYSEGEEEVVIVKNDDENCFFDDEEYRKVTGYIEKWFEDKENEFVNH